MNPQTNKAELKLNVSIQLVVCADDINWCGEHMYTIK